MLAALRALNTALTEGLVSEEEHQKERQAILGGDRERTMAWLPVEHRDTNTLETKIDSLLSALQPSSHGGLPKYERPQEMLVKPKAREEGQRSLLNFNITAFKRQRDGRQVQLHEADLASKTKAFSCSFAGCHRTFKRACHLKNHERTHTAAACKKPRTILQMQAMRNAMSQAQLRLQCHFDAKDIVLECIEAAATKAISIGGWSKKEDGRRKNSGASRRAFRSAQFKKTVILDYERYCKQYPAVKGEMATHVADIHGTSPGQVRAWFREKDSIFERATNRVLGRTGRKRKPRGRFHKVETILFDKFQEERKQQRRVGPRWLCRMMLRDVKALVPPPPMATSFSARRGWLRRFTKRFGIVLRRKTNNKKTPIQDRVPFLQRWFAVFRKWLKSKSNEVGYTPRWGIYRHRYSVDQVPAGDFDPKSTYEVKGVKRVVIAANEAFDKYRWLTLQVLIRNTKDPTKPRHGQPKLCLCFRGTGVRIPTSEKEQYHKDVIVLFQPKAWFDALTCNKWVMEHASQEIDKSELRPGERFLILGDNLSGQTVKTNPQFSKLLSELCSADFWSLLANNTDEIQVVDAGFGKLVKFETEEIVTDWLKDDTNFEEWQGGRMSASRKRILMTHWYAAGYERACARFDFVSVFERTGSNLSADGSTDSCIKLQGLDQFSFSDADLNRDPKTGIMGTPPAITNTIAIEAVAAATAADSEDDENDPESASEAEEKDESGGETTEELDGPDFDLDVDIYEDPPANYPTSIINKRIYHRYDDGWYPGTVLRQITLSTVGSRNGKFACKFTDSINEITHLLQLEDYGRTGHWTLAKGN